MKLTGEELAKSLTKIITDRKIAIIKEVQRNAWEENKGIDVPEFQKPEDETFEYHFYNVYLPPLLNGWHFHETFNWALGQLEMKRLLKLQQQ